MDFEKQLDLLLPSGVERRDFGEENSIKIIKKMRAGARGALNRSGYIILAQEGNDTTMIDFGLRSHERYGQYVILGASINDMDIPTLDAVEKLSAILRTCETNSKSSS